MTSCYDEAKATQIAACFIKRSGGKLNYTKLIKLMYVLERYAICNWGYSLTHDDLYWLKNGPILSKTLDLVRHESECQDSITWKDFIKKSRYDVVLIADPGHSHLSEVVLGMISRIWGTFGHLSWQEIVHLLHAKLPERRELDQGSDRLTLEEILRLCGKVADPQGLAQEIAAFQAARSHARGGSAL